MPPNVEKYPWCIEHQTNHLCKGSPAEALRQQVERKVSKWFGEPVLSVEGEIMELVTAYAATVEREARKDELLEIGLLAHKFEGEDYHCREIADAIDGRLAALQGPIQGDSNTSEEASSTQ